MDYVAALDDAEWAQLVADARGTTTAEDARIRTAEQAGDWQAAFALKRQLLGRLMNPPTTEKD